MASSPQRPCLPVGGEVRVAGFGEACALQVVRIGVRVRGAVAAAWWGAGLELEPAEFAGDEQRSLVVVVLLLGEQVPGEDRELAGDGDDRDLRSAARLDAQVERVSADRVS